MTSASIRPYPAMTLADSRAAADRHARSALAAAVLGFFVVTLDAVVVNVTLPSIRVDLGGGVAGLQWIVDGYTLMFAALLLSAGSFSDRVGARRAFGGGMVVITVASGFAFMAGYYGLPFVISLFLQQHRGLSALHTGVVFLPMMLIGLVLTPFSARLGERLGRKSLIVTGLAPMAVGLAAVGLLPASAPLWLLAGLMMLVGLGGPTVSPPATAVLLDAVAHEQAGVASGVFNTSRQVGGALAVAVFGGLLANPATFVRGVHTSLLLAAGVLATTTVLALFLPTSTPTLKENSHDHPDT